VTLAVERDGAVTLSSLEIGGGPGAEWGLDDEDVTLTIPGEQVGRLALALAAELLKGGADPVRQLAEICEANAVFCKIACWS
jgi:hypothetical protein